MKNIISLKSLLIIFVSIFCFSFGIVSCASASTKAKTEVGGVEATNVSDAPVEASQKQQLPSAQIKDYFPTAENVKPLGRAVVERNQLLMCHSSTGAEFNVSAKYLEVTFCGDSNAGPNKDGDARVAVFVNGERMLDEMLTQSAQSFVVFNEKEAVNGLVQVLKVSECANAVCSLYQISVDKEGSISPAAERPLKIEFIGDSITCGYGVDDLDRNHHFKTSTEDNTKTYAYKTAAALNADYSMVSFSGWGIVSGYTGDGKKNTTSLVPPNYSKLGFTWNSRISGVRPQTVEWDFSRFQPDFVVINLGTNDASYTKNVPDKMQEYKDAYISFLKDVREKNPDAAIICTLGIMGDTLYGAIEEMVEQYKSETGDEKISALRFPPQSMSDGIAADWHPSEKTHEKSAKILTDYIKSLQ